MVVPSKSPVILEANALYSGYIPLLIQWSPPNLVTIFALAAGPRKEWNTVQPACNASTMQSVAERPAPMTSSVRVSSAASSAPPHVCETCGRSSPATPILFFTPEVPTARMSRRAR